MSLFFTDMLVQAYDFSYLFTTFDHRDLKRSSAPGISWKYDGRDMTLTGFHSVEEDPVLV